MIWRRLKRRYKQNKLLKKLSIKNKISNGVILDEATIMEGDSLIQNNACVAGTTIGKCSYVGFDSYLPRSTIGRYCSIGPNVRVVVGNHPTRKFVSTHGAFYSKRFFRTYVTEQKYEEYSFADENQRFFVRIGNDVWIGSNALIMSGVTIEDGAVVAAGAVVTHDVEAYSIVGGVPAKRIRYRFDDEEIEFLKQTAWWNKSEKWILEHAQYFEDVKVLRQIIRKEELT